MTIFPVPRIYPTPARWEDRIRNGKEPDWHVPAFAARRGHFALTYSRKLVFHKTVNAASPPQGIAGTTTPYKWHMQTGDDTQSGDKVKVRAVAMMLPASNAAAVDPRFVLNIGGSASGPGRYTFVDTSPTYDQLSEVEVLVTDLAEDTTFECSIDIIDYARLVSVSVYEEVTHGVDTAATSVTDVGQFASGAEITDAQHQELSTDLHTIWKHNATCYFSLSPNVVANFYTRTTNSYVNVLDDASTSVSADSPGYNLAARFHNAQHTDNVPCVFAAYGSTASGTNGNVQLVNSGGVLTTISNFTTTPTWRTAAVDLDGSIALDKVDVWFQGDGTNEFTLEAVSLYARVA